MLRRRTCAFKYCILGIEYISVDIQCAWIRLLLKVFLCILYHLSVFSIKRTYEKTLPNEILRNLNSCRNFETVCFQSHMLQLCDIYCNMSIRLDSLLFECTAETPLRMVANALKKYFNLNGSRN